MTGLLRYAAAFLASIATLLFLTTASALALILLGFRGTASFPAECGLVFGAAITGKSNAGPAIVRRVGEAARLWKEGQVKTLILTGGKGDSWQFSEAAVMRQEAIRQGVDGRDILIEDGARSTKENLANSRVLVEEYCSSVIAISDRYHLARIRLLAKRAGWGSLPTHGAEDLSPPGATLRSPFTAKARTVMRELAAYVYYAVGADAFLHLEEYDDGPSADGSGSGSSLNTP